MQKLDETHTKNQSNSQFNDSFKDDFSITAPIVAFSQYKLKNINSTLFKLPLSIDSQSG